MSLDLLRRGWRWMRWTRQVTKPDVLREMVARRFRKFDPSLVVLDDVYPNPLGAWRTAEFHAYLDAFPRAEIHVDDALISAGGWLRSRPQAFRWLREHHPQYADRVRPWVNCGRIRAAGYYCIFLNNLRKFLPYIESQRTPFVFTLYPGGGFCLDDPAVDASLRQIFRSPSFHGVIVTQHVTWDYLTQKGLLDPSRARMIWGGPMPAAQLHAPLPPRPADKPTLDIGFIAHKYTPRGADKGYDTFVAFAELLASRLPEATFHVVGPFTPDDVPEARVYDRFRFHGTMPADQLPTLLAELDVIVSPNVPFRLAPGAFDGFPTGGCVQAAMAGVAVFCSNVLNERTEFVDGRDLVVVPPIAAEFADRVAEYARDRDRLRRLGVDGSATFRRVFSNDAQIRPRVEVLGRLIGTRTNEASP